MALELNGNQLVNGMGWEQLALGHGVREGGKEQGTPRQYTLLCNN